MAHIVDMDDSLDDDNELDITVMTSEGTEALYLTYDQFYRIAAAFGFERGLIATREGEPR